MDESKAATRVTVDALDAILGKKFAVLDDGFVRVVDYLGSDSSIVQAARVSYGAGTKAVSEDRALIRYLLRHQHTTPFEMCELKLHIRVPMDCWRQWIRHRTANVNEYSTRYSIAIDAAQRTAANQWRSQALTNKQGSSGYLDPVAGEKLSAREAALASQSREVYQERIDLGVAREQARKDLPLSTYTEAYWKIDLHNLLRFLALRMDAHAQAEIRDYANVIGTEILARWCPLTWQGFSDYWLNSIRLTACDIAVIRTLGDPDAAVACGRENGLLREEAGRLLPTREGSEFLSKLRSLGIPSPWNDAS